MDDLTTHSLTHSIHLELENTYGNSDDKFWAVVLLLKEISIFQLFQDLCGDEKKARDDNHPTKKFVFKNTIYSKCKVDILLQKILMCTLH